MADRRPDGIRIIAKVIVIGRDAPFACRHLERDCQLDDLPISFTVECAAGVQTWKWLGTFVCQRYSKTFGFHANEFVPINITNVERLALFPWQDIAERCINNDQVLVEILGPGIGPNDTLVPRDRTFWELYAYADRSMWVRMRIVYEHPSGDSTTPVGIIGNFNGWAAPEPMQFNSGRFEHWLDVPPDSMLVFRFVVDECDFVSDGYPIVRDTEGEQFNVLKSQFETMMDMNSTLTPRLSGTPRTPRRQKSASPAATNDAFVLSESQKNDLDMMRQFEEDWNDVRLADIVNGEGNRAIFKQEVYRSYAMIRFMFQYFCSVSDSSVIGCMSLAGFSEFIDQTGIKSFLGFNRALTRELFERVNIEEVQHEEMLDAGLFRDTQHLEADDTNPDRLLTRGEFIEALSRISQVAPGDLSYEAKLTVLLDHIRLKVEQLGDADPGLKLQHVMVEGEFRKHSRRLHAQFDALARQDEETKELLLGPDKFVSMPCVKILIGKNVSKRKLLAAFAMAKSPAKITGRNQIQLDYREFTNAIGRVANCMYDGTSLNVQEKLRRMLQEILR